MLNFFKGQEIIECLNFIEGKWVLPPKELSELKSPITGKTIAKTFQSEVSTLNKVVESAKKAHNHWSHISIRERASILFRFREWLLQNIDDISLTISQESGKLAKEAHDGLLKGIEIIEFAISLPNSEKLNKIEVSQNVSCEYRREALGVVAGITPFNFPAMVPLWMIPNALIVGNAFIWKPSEKTPMTSLLLADGLQKAGLPDGVLSIVQGDKHTAEALCEHTDIKAIAFVGSSSVAQHVYQRATQKNKRALALGGAKNQIILTPDANPELAVDGILASFTGCAGQRCMAGSVLLAVGDVEHMIQSICKKAENFVVGKDIGAIISNDSLKKIKAAIKKGLDEGAKIRVDGRNCKVDKSIQGGNWLNPTILDHVSPESSIAQEEIFGPVLSIIHCSSIETAIEIENNNKYGNATSVFTTRGDIANHVITNSTAGMVGVNIGIPVPREPFSFGGTKMSRFGHGDITGESGLNFWSQFKKITTKWIQPQNTNWMS